MHLRSGYFGQGYFKARHFGIVGIITRVIITLSGPMKRIAPVVKFKKIRPIQEFERDY